MKRLLANLLLLVPLAALAQYPDRVTRIVSPFSPGGGLDIVARLIAPKLSEAYKQPVIVENRTGANGVIAVDFVAKAPPDGYTLLIDTLGVSIHPAVLKNPPYDPLKSLEPVAQLLSLPFVAVVSPKVEAKNTRELIELAKRNPGKLNYAQGGMSNRILGELFRLQTGTEFTFVPYKGSNPATQAVLSGEADLIITDSITVASHIASGRLRAFAVTSPKRAASLPDVPTATEAGVPDYAVVVWYGIFAPGGTPPAVVRRLNTELNRIVFMPDVAARFANLGAEPVAATPEAFGELFRGQVARWKDVAMRAKIPVE
jgi:tripartite-type tricarboxylate transporter receptor subunit TctC